MQLNLKQTIALDYLEDISTEEVLFGGAAGPGKSSFICYWQLKRRLKYPGTRGLIGRAHLKTLKETTLKTFFEIAEKQGVKRGRHFDLTSSQDKENPNCLVFSNGSLIFLRDLFHYPADPDFDELGSLEITDAAIDECSQVVAKAKNILKVRIRYQLDKFCDICADETKSTVLERDVNGKPVKWICGKGHITSGLMPKILYATNPAKNWAYDEFYRPSKDGVILAYRKFVQAFAYDNPDYPKSSLESLKNMPEGPEKERLYYGNWEYSDDPRSLCDYDAILDMFTNEVAPTGKKAISADLAMQGRDRFVAAPWDGLICNLSRGVDKVKATGIEIEQDIKKLMLVNLVGHSQTVIDSDGMGAYLESYLKGIKEFHGGAQAFDKVEFANLKAECAYKLAEFTNNRQIKIICSEEQKYKIIRQMGALKSKSVDADESRKRIINKEEMKEELNGQSPDYLDMLLMKMIFHVAPKFEVVAH
jgi:phage terminase large subunit